jgi:hypothetical protein
MEGMRVIGDLDEGEMMTKEKKINLGGSNTVEGSIGLALLADITYCRKQRRDERAITMPSIHLSSEHDRNHILPS